jgi:hypothetical protein
MVARIKLFVKGTSRNLIWSPIPPKSTQDHSIKLDLYCPFLSFPEKLLGHLKHSTITWQVYRSQKQRLSFEAGGFSAQILGQNNFEIAFHKKF